MATIVGRHSLSWRGQASLATGQQQRDDPQRDAPANDGRRCAAHGRPTRSPCTPPDESEDTIVADMRSVRRPQGRRAFLIAFGAGLAAVATGCTSSEQHDSEFPRLRRATMPCGQERITMDATQKEIAQRLVSSAENSSLDWRAQYAYIEDIGDGRGFTGGIIRFFSGPRHSSAPAARAP